MDNLEMLIDNEMNNGELILTVNEMTRELEYNGNLVIGVEGDYKADRVYFISPKIVGDNIDVSASTVQIYIDYKNALNESYITQSTDKAVQTDGTVKFSWVLGANVAAKKGQVKFRVCFKNINTSGELTNEWHTTYTTGEILEGIDVSEKTPEVITDETTTTAAVLARMDEMETTFNNATGYTKEEINGVEINGKTLGSDLKAEISAEDIKLRAGEDIDVYSKLNNIDLNISNIHNGYLTKMTELYSSDPLDANNFTTAFTATIPNLNRYTNITVVVTFRDGNNSTFSTTEFMYLPDVTLTSINPQIKVITMPDGVSKFGISLVKQSRLMRFFKINNTEFIINQIYIYAAI